MNSFYFPGYEIKDAELTRDNGVALVLENFNSDTSMLVKLNENLNIVFSSGIERTSGHFLDIVRVQIHNNSYFTISNSKDSLSSLNIRILMLIDSVGYTACGHFTTDCIQLNIDIDAGVIPYSYTFPSAFMFSIPDPVIQTVQQSIVVNTECISTSINEITTNQITIFPNPLYDQVEINSIDLKANINIFNLLGNLVETIHDLVLPGKVWMQKYPKGIYFISVEGIKVKAVIRVILL